MKSRFRLLDRSTIVPAQIDSSRIGPYWHEAARAEAEAETEAVAADLR